MNTTRGYLDRLSLARHCVSAYRNDECRIQFLVAVAANMTRNKTMRAHHLTDQEVRKVRGGWALISHMLSEPVTLSVGDAHKIYDVMRRRNMGCVLRYAEHDWEQCAPVAIAERRMVA